MVNGHAGSSGNESGGLLIRQIPAQYTTINVQVNAIAASLNEFRIILMVSGDGGVCFRIWSQCTINRQ